MKKKKKKKVVEIAETERIEGPPTPAEPADDDDDDVPTGHHLDDVADDDLGENVFEQAAAPTGVDTGKEAWLSSDRDYTYDEVSSN